jgi:MarR family transcriptional regulator, 2-MHQ and catechol-resistance regulon repressor
MTIETISPAQQQHRLIHDIYVLLDDGDRRVLSAADLAPLEFAVLRRLDAHEGRRLIDVGAELLCVKSTITRVVDRLERAGLVSRMPDADDRRAQRLTLTRRGLLVRDQAIDLHTEAVERRMGLLSDEEQVQLGSLLAKLRLGLEEDLREQGDGSD